MDDEIKAFLKNTVERGTLKNVQDAFSQHKLKLDRSYFDYEVLKSALLRGDSKIANYLLSLGCRAKRPNGKNPGESPLHLAVENVKKGIHKLAITLISKGASIYAKNASGDTPLSTAFKARNYEAVQALLDYCTVSVNPRKKDDMVHFHIACVSNSNHHIVQQFLAAGFDPQAPLLLDSQEYVSLNPVLYAIRHNFKRLFKILVKKLNLTVKNNEGLTLLHYIYYYGENDLEKWVDLAITISSKDVVLNNCEDEHHLSYFHLCCMVGKSEFIQAFIDNGESTNSPVSIESPKNAGFTPLHFAVYFSSYSTGSTNGIKILLQNEADPNRKDKEGRTPLYLISKRLFIQDFKIIYVNILEILLKFKADPVIPDEQGCTPLHFLFKYFFFKRYTVLGSKHDSSTFPVELLRISWGSINYTDEEGLSLFHIACAVNHVDQVLRFLDAGVDIESSVNIYNCNGYTALHIAAKFKRSDVVQELLRRNANVNARTDGNDTPLHLACECNSTEEDDNVDDFLSNQLNIGQLLLSHGADVNARDSSGSTPLLRIICAMNAQWDMKFCLNNPTGVRNSLMGNIGLERLERNVKILLKFKANPSIPDETACTPLHYLFKFKYFYFNPYFDRYCGDNDSTFRLEMLLRVPWGSINCTDEEGLSLFHVACAVNNVDQVVRFLDAGVDIESSVDTYNWNGYTALHIAAKYKRADIVQELLRRNADVNARTVGNDTPLHLACECNLEIEKYNVDDVITNQLKIVRLLLSHGADVNARDSLKFTPLLRTCMMNSDDIGFLNRQCTVSYNNLMDKTGVRWLETLKILLLNKADVNARTNSQSSILHFMSEYKFLNMGAKIVDYLVISGADVNAADKNGLTPLHVSAKYGNKELVESLLTHDAKPSIKCKKRKIPLRMFVDEIEKFDEDFDDRFASDDISVLNALLEYSVDVNVANIASDCCVSKLLRHLKQNVNIDPDVHLEMFRIIYTHVQKLLALGLPVSQSAKSCCARLHSYYKRQYAEDDETLPNLDNTFNECVNELDRMKDVKIDSYTSLHDILLKTPQELVSHVINDSLKEIINNSEVERDFPKYSCLLKRQYKKGLKRSDVLQSAVEALSKVLKVVLPDHCNENILKYLDDDDVALLKEVASAKRNLKRKLSDIITIQSESDPKLKKNSKVP